MILTMTLIMYHDPAPGTDLNPDHDPKTNPESNLKPYPDMDPDPDTDSDPEFYQSKHSS